MLTWIVSCSNLYPLICANPILDVGVTGSFLSTRNKHLCIVNAMFCSVEVVFSLVEVLWYMFKKEHSIYDE